MGLENIDLHITNLNCLPVLLVNINPHGCFLKLWIGTSHHIVVQVFLQTDSQNGMSRSGCRFNPNMQKRHEESCNW